MAGFRIYVLSLALLLPIGSMARSTQQLDCLNNLRMLDGAKMQLEIEGKLKPGTAVQMDMITNYLTRVPKCTSGGTYTLGPIGTDTTCSFPGHSDAAFQRQIKFQEQKELIIYGSVGAAILTVMIWCLWRFSGFETR